MSKSGLIIGVMGKPGENKAWQRADTIAEKYKIYLYGILQRVEMRRSVTVDIDSPSRDLYNSNVPLAGFEQHLHFKIITIGADG